jgi:magnesium transporter
MGENKTKFKKETAGRILTTNVPIVDIDENVGGIEKLLIKDADKFSSINYVYVVNKRKKLAGVASIKEVFRQKKDTKIKKIMTDELVVSRSNTDQEKIVYKALKYNIKAVPIVDKNGFFLGVVQSDDILRVLYEETEEDIFQMAGVLGTRNGFDNIMNISIFKSFWHRFPWLFVGLLGGLFIAKIIGVFEEIFYFNITLIVFIPLVTYIASAVSTQMSTFLIRDLAIGNGFSFMKYFFRNFLIVFLIAIFSGVSFFLLDLIIYKDFTTGIILSVAIFVAIMSALFTGLVVPLVLNKMKIDPANASGPFGTIMQDTLSVVIYFLVISMML